VVLKIGYWKIDEKDLESVPMWCWKRTGNISWTDHVRNKEVLLRPRRRKYRTNNKKNKG